MRIALAYTLLFLALDLSAQTRLFDDEQKIAAWMKEANVPAAGVGVIRDGKLVQVEVYGQLQQGVRAPYDTLFNVASLTKPVVTMLTLQLVAQGKWQLDEPLAKYWVDPDVAADPRHRQLTTRHVLSHTTGFRNWRFQEEGEKLTFHADPGTTMQYSGEGFEYLREALERKFKKSLPELAQALVFEPLKMHDTQFAWDARTDESRFARWHDGEGKHAYTQHRKTTVNAADDLLTTVEDYGRFGAWVLGGAGLPPALFTEMTKDQSGVKENYAMGLGWELHRNLGDGETVLIHGGADKGVAAVIMLLPKSKQGLVVMTNADNGYRLYEKLVTELLDVGAQLMSRAGK